MKKIISITLSALLLLSLLGCQRPAQSETTPTTEPTDPSDLTTVTTVDIPFTAVGLPTVTDTANADDGTVIFTKTEQSITMTLSGQAAADQIVLDFLNRIDAGTASADSILDSARNAYASNTSGNWIPYSCSIRYDPTRIDQGVLSLFGNNITYTGGSHPDYRCVAVNYNLITGEALSLGSILTGVEAVDQLHQLVLEELEKQKEEKYLRTGYQQTVEERFAGEESHNYDWYFSDAGLCFYFAPYEIAPYSSGVITAQIPYEKLLGIITDEFFPPEQQNLKGTVEFLSFDADEQQYAHISELILHNDGQMYTLRTDSCVQDIRIMSTDGQTQERHAIYAALYLNPGDAIVLQCSDSSLSTMFVEYTSNGQTVTLPLA